MTFEELNLNKPLLNALADMEYIYPTPIQAQAFNVVMSGKNVVGIAQTGTGKTFAYLLPIIRQLSFSKQRDPRVLIVAPTHELVVQIVDEVNKLCTYSSLRVAGVFGGVNMSRHRKLVYDGLDILVATPGRLLDLVYTGVLSLKAVKKLVIDEVDEMLSLGFRTQLNSILEILPEKRQNLMFSATLSEEVEGFIEENFTFLEKIEIAPHGTPLDKIIQYAYHVPNFNTKINLLELLLKNEEEMNKVLVFASTKKLADRIFEKMDKIFPDSFGVIHSNKAHNTRMSAVEDFKSGDYRVLIATDVIARGMDISDVSHVINFDMTSEQGEYMHRIGRTGRADSNGVAISFINEKEQEYQMMVEKLMGKQIPLVALPEDLEVSNVFGEDEKPEVLFDKNYLEEVDLKSSKGAFHQKSQKNIKQNSGSASRHKASYTKSGKKIKNKKVFGKNKKK